MTDQRTTLDLAALDALYTATTQASWKWYAGEHDQDPPVIYYEKGLGSEWVCQFGGRESAPDDVFPDGLANAQFMIAVHTAWPQIRQELAAATERADMDAADALLQHPEYQALQAEYRAMEERAEAAAHALKAALDLAHDDCVRADQAEQERDTATTALAAAQERNATLANEIQFLVAVGKEHGVTLTPGWVERLERLASRE